MGLAMWLAGKGIKNLPCPFCSCRVVAALLWNKDGQLSFSVPLLKNILLYTIVYQQLTGPVKWFMGVLNLQVRFT